MPSHHMTEEEPTTETDMRRVPKASGEEALRGREGSVPRPGHRAPHLPLSPAAARLPCRSHTKSDQRRSRNLTGFPGWWEGRGGTAKVLQRWGN